ncbi:DUF551 domain-containing protein [Tatumella punctata]|uniref:DUF551 domain-containing protein n=1 Tax=Tatumella punctata TaxID=399969 RepID=A0ABW1VN71_9GAMM
MLNPDDIKSGYTLGHADALMLRELVEKTKLIPVSDRLPEDSSTMVLALEADGSAWIAYYDKFRERWDDGDFHDDITGVTHWMPLPEPPA